MLSRQRHPGRRMLASWAMAITLLAGCEEIYPIGSGSGTRDAASSDAGGGGTGDADGGSASDGAITACECSGPRPLAPNVECADGSIGGPICAQHGDGTCGWEVRSCPPEECPALGCNPLCPHGVREDEHGCPTCQCQEADPCAGLSCGDPCTTCGAGGPCLGIAQFCDATGTCAAALPTCPPPATLHWYPTCGDPVCGLPPADPGADGCGTIEEGDPCTDPEGVCDLADGCGGKLRCAREPFDLDNCPISSARHKMDIDYLTARDLEKVARKVQGIRLATYHYKAQAPDEQKHLGFIIEDDPRSPAVFTHRDRVDVYGYASMAVAALQVQERRIQVLERELAELRARLETSNAAGMCGGAVAP